MHEQDVSQLSRGATALCNILRKLSTHILEERGRGLGHLGAYACCSPLQNSTRLQACQAFGLLLCRTTRPSVDSRSRDPQNLQSEAFRHWRCSRARKIMSQCSGRSHLERGWRSRAPPASWYRIQQRIGRQDIQQLLVKEQTHDPCCVPRL